jgi:hypothetical protein
MKKNTNEDWKEENKKKHEEKIKKQEELEKQKALDLEKNKEKMVVEDKKEEATVNPMLADLKKIQEEKYLQSQRKIEEEKKSKEKEISEEKEKNKKSEEAKKPEMTNTEEVKQQDNATIKARAEKVEKQNKLKEPDDKKKLEETKKQEENKKREEQKTVNREKNKKIALLLGLGLIAGIITFHWFVPASIAAKLLLKIAFSLFVGLTVFTLPALYYKLLDFKSVKNNLNPNKKTPQQEYEDELSKALDELLELRNNVLNKVVDNNLNDQIEFVINNSSAKRYDEEGNLLPIQQQPQYDKLYFYGLEKTKLKAIQETTDDLKEVFKAELLIVNQEEIIPKLAI